MNISELLELSYYAMILAMGAILAALFIKSRWFDVFEAAMDKWSQKIF